MFRAAPPGVGTATSGPPLAEHSLGHEAVVRGRPRSPARIQWQDLALYQYRPRSMPWRGENDLAFEWLERGAAGGERPVGTRSPQVRPDHSPVAQRPAVRRSFTRMKLPLDLSGSDPTGNERRHAWRCPAQLEPGHSCHPRAAPAGAHPADPRAARLRRRRRSACCSPSYLSRPRLHAVRDRRHRHRHAARLGGAHAGRGPARAGIAAATACSSAPPALMLATGLGFAGVTASGRCWWSRSSARSTRRRATSASSCPPSRRCSRETIAAAIAPRCSPATTSPARSRGALGALASGVPALVARALGSDADGRRALRRSSLYALRRGRRRRSLPRGLPARRSSTPRRRAARRCASSRAHRAAARGAVQPRLVRRRLRRAVAPRAVALPALSARRSATAGAVFFVAGLCGAFSQLVVGARSRRASASSRRWSTRTCPSNVLLIARRR